MKQYNVDPQRWKEIRKTIYKQHPRWKRTKKHRIAARILLLVTAAGALVTAYRNPEGILGVTQYDIDQGYTVDTFDYIVSAILYLIMFEFVPGLIYFIWKIVLVDRCRGSIGTTDMVLFTTDDCIREVFSGSRSKYVNEIPYEKIDRILWNECQQRFEIFSEMTRIHYVDYQRDKVDMRNKETYYVNHGYHLYWTFNQKESKEFCQTVKNHTGLEIEIKKEATE